jgi:hypothetical protein
VDQFISINKFCRMMSRNRSWFYRHANEPGFPQRIYVREGDPPHLSLAECQDYMERLKQRRGPQAPLKRRVGRPRKAA